MLDAQARAAGLVKEEEEAAVMRIDMLSHAAEMGKHYDANRAAWEAKQIDAGEENWLQEKMREEREVSIRTALLCC